MKILGLIYTTILQFSCIGVILLLIACFRKSFYPILAGCLLFAVFFLDSIILRLPGISGFSQSNINWEGKILECLWPLLLVYILRWLSAKEVGYNFPNHNIDFIYAGVFGVLFAALMLVHEDSFNRSISGEALLYQFTLPGLAEESVYRGIFLAILNRYLARDWNIFGIKFGWGVILISILFFLIHIFYYVPSKGIVWNLDLHIWLILFISFTLGFLREKSGSIWPSVLCHNLANGLYFLGLWFNMK